MKPLVVYMYNKYMLGVDWLDQRMAYYQFTRKSVRWWRKFFFWMVDVAIVNAHILYTTHTNTRRPLIQKGIPAGVANLSLPWPAHPNVTTYPAKTTPEPGKSPRFSLSWDQHSLPRLPSVQCMRSRWTEKTTTKLIVVHVVITPICVSGSVSGGTTQHTCRGKKRIKQYMYWHLL